MVYSATREPTLIRPRRLMIGANITLSTVSSISTTRPIGSLLNQTQNSKRD